jgi:hypothetical protein
MDWERFFHGGECEQLGCGRFLVGWVRAKIGILSYRVVGRGAMKAGGL